MNPSMLTTPSSSPSPTCEHTDSRRFALLKKYIITIQNDDNICCARALITAKARIHQNDSDAAHMKWNSQRKGRHIQFVEACKLHHEAHIPQGPCGPDELHLFSLAPSLYDYQIIVVDATRDYRNPSCIVKRPHINSYSSTTTTITRADMLVNKIKIIVLPVCKTVALTTSNIDDATVPLLYPAGSAAVPFMERHVSNNIAKRHMPRNQHLSLVQVCGPLDKNVPRAINSSKL